MHCKHTRANLSRPGELVPNDERFRSPTAHFEWGNIRIQTSKAKLSTEIAEPGSAQALDAVKATAGWEPAEAKADGTPQPPKPLPKRYVRLLRDTRAAIDRAKAEGGTAGAALEGGKVWLERPGCKSQADARARALIELEMLLNFWGAAADGMPENLKAEACYEVAMGDVELDEGPVGIIMSYLHKEDHEN
jgi:hypothetical protein